MKVVEDGLQKVALGSETYKRTAHRGLLAARDSEVQKTYGGCAESVRPCDVGNPRPCIGQADPYLRRSTLDHES